MSVQCKWPHMNMNAYGNSHHHHHVNNSRPCMQRPRDSFNADSDAPSTSERLHICESSGMHNQYIIILYTPSMDPSIHPSIHMLAVITLLRKSGQGHTLSHKHIHVQCAQAFMAYKPAHRDCIYSYVVHNRASLTTEI